MPITPIADTAALKEFCTRQATASYIAVDTEFVRERTYWPILCLVQIASPEDAAVIDAQAEGLDLSPIGELLSDRRILKVFHAGRQDIEIFYHRFGGVPAPIFDTQVAAMVCGYGDQVSYETLVAKTLGVRIEKTSRFADWSHRPLTQKQLSYALSDVVHLRSVYEKLARQLETNGRAHWLEEEMAVLADPATYRLDPDEAWRRIRSRSASPRFLAVLREIAAWREREAQRRDVPRNRLVRDDSLLDIAAHTPRSPEELARTRGLPNGFARSRMAKELLAAVRRGLAVPEEQLPQPVQTARLPRGLGPVVDLLKTLLKHNCERHRVATRLVASSEDLQKIAADDMADVPALHGWRREIFGADALALKNGRIALTVDRGQIRVIECKPNRHSARSEAP